jgi:hypothetical protein
VLPARPVPPSTPTYVGVVLPCTFLVVRCAMNGERCVARYRCTALPGCPLISLQEGLGPI